MAGPLAPSHGPMTATQPATRAEAQHHTIRSCRCGTIPYEPCQGTDGRGCGIAPGPEYLPLDALLGRWRWWTCLVGSTWSLVDSTEHPKAAERRARDTVAKGGVVRPATPLEVLAWGELLVIGAELRQASTKAERLDVLATDAMGVVQLGMELGG